MDECFCYELIPMSSTSNLLFLLSVILTLPTPGEIMLASTFNSSMILLLLALQICPIEALMHCKVVLTLP